ncbi:hypothetical protein GCM10028808_59080 [Spirosoma migulaei]
MIGWLALCQSRTNGQNDYRNKHQEDMDETEEDGVHMANFAFSISPKVLNNRTREVECEAYY